MTKKLLRVLCWLLDRLARLAGKGIVWEAPSLPELRSIMRRPDQRILHIIYAHSQGLALRIDDRFGVGYYTYE